MQYNYHEVIQTIENSRRFGKYTGYEVSKNILEQLGHPEEGMPFVHVAGTNGKGSTTAFLCKILEQTGRKVGMFTSPHLVEFGERIRINGVYISKEDITRIGNLLLNTEFELPPTMFDYCLAMAVLYFREQKCDIVVYETGIGGRYDSTNALGTPEVAIITKIGFDHMAVLGNTLEEIAGEKAGIIKKGCSVVTAMQQPSVAHVLKENYIRVNYEPGGMPVFHEISDEDIKYVESIPMKMLGSYQLENAATAVLAAKLIFQKWQNIENLCNAKRPVTGGQKIGAEFTKAQQENCIRNGIAQTFWKGRMELMSKEPFLLIDGAHNAHGVHALAESLKALYPNEKFHFIMGVMADKDYEDMITELLPMAMDFTTVTPESSRALQAKDLAACIAKKGIPATHKESVAHVLAPFLRGNEESQGKTVAFGSLYFIGEIEALFLERNHKL